MKYSILSLTKVHDSILMWAHYCEDHTGFVVEVDIQNYFFNQQPGVTLREVSYTKNRPKFSFPDFVASLEDQKTHPDENHSSQIQDIFHTKSNDWQYEEEWRLVVSNLSNYAKLEDCTSCDGNPVPGLKKLPIDAFNTIILGCRGSYDHVAQALEFGKQNNIQIDQMKDHSTDYKIVRKNLYKSG